MARRRPVELSVIETEAIATIRAWRLSVDDPVSAILLQNPAQIMHNFVLVHHGHVQLRFSPLAAELGIEMRTLERAFLERYKKTMLQCQIEARLAFSQLLLSMIPPTKISVVANLLGYKEPRDFIRFFEKHMKQTPSSWRSSGRHTL